VNRRLFRCELPLTINGEDKKEVKLKKLYKGGYFE